LLGGTAVIYYGEEIGMEDLPRCDLLFEDCKDHRGIKYGVINHFHFSFLCFNGNFKFK
jgi:hypothetical protein